MNIQAKQLALVSLLFLLFRPLTPGQSDPLSSVYMPPINQNPTDYPPNIWVTGPLAKVQQDAGSPGKVKWAIVYATQNEFQSFQIHIHTGAGGVWNLAVAMSDLVNSRTGTHISASSTDIVVYREAYIHVTIKTSMAVTYYNARGYYPDVLIPAPSWTGPQPPRLRRKIRLGFDNSPRPEPTSVSPSLVYMPPLAPFYQKTGTPGRRMDRVTRGNLRLRMLIRSGGSVRSWSRDFSWMIAE